MPASNSSSKSFLKKLVSMLLGSHTTSKSLSTLWTVDRKMGEAHKMVVNLVVVLLIKIRLTRVASLREVKVDQILKQVMAIMDNHLLSSLLMVKMVSDAEVSWSILTLMRSSKRTSFSSLRLTQLTLLDAPKSNSHSKLTWRE